MEWTGRQQLFMLVQCGGVGFALGILRDLFSTVGRVSHHTRPAVFLGDVLFFAISALITFYSSMAIMDGHMHPLLFVGCVIGFAAERFSISRGLRRLLAAFCFFFGAFLRRGRGCLSLILSRFTIVFFAFKKKLKTKTPKNKKKL